MTFSGGQGGTIDVKTTGGSCAGATDVFFSDFGPRLGGGNIDFSVVNCDCVGGLGCLLAGGILDFSGTFSGRNQMRGTFTLRGSLCSCCTCSSYASGSWEVSR